jgi:hypothetical protein
LDALIAIRGSKGTRQELALALEFGTRILPVPAFGGAAEAVWAGSQMMTCRSISATTSGFNTPPTTRPSAGNSQTL